MANLGLAWRGAVALACMGGAMGCGSVSTPTPEAPAPAVAPNSETAPTPETAVASEAAAPPPQAEAVALPAADQILMEVLALVEGRDLCDGFYNPEQAKTASQVYDLGGQALVEVVCDTTAYQVVYTYVVYGQGARLQPLPLEVFYPDDGGSWIRATEPTISGLATFEPGQRLLSIFSKGRGVGDCGAYGEYRWTDSALELVTYRYRSCEQSDGTFIDPSQYPLVFP